ncbi:hypothetical protein H4Q32_030850 [Labeo rohita]|uniref:Uncharacterized protein n=1 Tax=Labeo rohita TaxID=84645 RepID=A0ABQ8L9B0_LABRO|nr:hypothetical protein H4Q32_030850 [Labeo rohita]
MASTSKTFKKCADPCPTYFTPDDTHDLCIMCLGEEHARNVLEGAVCVHCERLSMKTLRSRPAAAEARRKLSSWGSQMDLTDKLDKGLSLSRSSVGDESELLEDDDVISLTSSDPAASAILGSTQEEQELLDEEMQSESSQSSCPAYAELLEVMERATARLDLPLKRMRKAATRGRLDEPFLSDHNPLAQVSLPFLPDLHTEVVKAWEKPFSSRIHRFQQTCYANIEGMCENGYERMPPIEETLASYLSSEFCPQPGVLSLDLTAWQHGYNRSPISTSRGSSSSSLKGNVSCYVCNPGYLRRERDTASSRLVAMLRTHASDEEVDVVFDRRPFVQCGRTGMTRQQLRVVPGVTS